MCIINKIRTWYRAQNYCPVIDSLYNEPELWVGGTEYKLHKQMGHTPRYRGDSGYYWYDSSSLYHKELGTEITNYDYTTLPKTVRRNGHTLPVNNGRLKRALKDREIAKAQKRQEAARAELNRLTQDAQTLRLARIVELRKALAVAEAAEFNFKLEDQSNV